MIFWCEHCNIPISTETCDLCGNQANPVSTDLRPVFPEEALLWAILNNKPFNYYQGKSVWNGSGYYIVDGKKEKGSVGRFASLTKEASLKIKQTYDENVKLLDYDFFNTTIEKYIAANRTRYNYITDEAVQFIQQYTSSYSIDDMFVSFSGGKDSTVTSHLVSRALGTNKVLHIFGDTTLEFPFTLEYKKRFNKNESSHGTRVITAKNREKNFEELCDTVGPPSRVMRWCCTVFKTGAIQKTISSAFKDKKQIISFQGIRHSESASRSKYDRESDSPKIAKQKVVAPIIDWQDFDVWLYILTTNIDFNYAYRIGYSRVGCWCCPNNGTWSETLSKIFLFDEYWHWNDLLLDFAKKTDKVDPEGYVSSGGWKARQGGNGLSASRNTVIKFEPCATEENAINYDLQRPISDSLYELFKPFGTINTELGNKRLGEVYILAPNGKVRIVLQGRIGSSRLKVIIHDIHIGGSVSFAAAEKKIQCQITKYQMCIGCKACEAVCVHDAITVRTISNDQVQYNINSDKCIHCSACVGHFDAGCYMRKVLKVKSETYGKN